MKGTTSVKDYILTVRTNFRPFILVTLLIISAFAAYAFFAKNIYKSLLQVRITTAESAMYLKLHQVITDSDKSANDRYIANEIEANRGL